MRKNLILEEQQLIELIDASIATLFEVKDRVSGTPDSIANPETKGDYAVYNLKLPIPTLKFLASKPGLAKFSAFLTFINKNSDIFTYVLAKTMDLTGIINVYTDMISGVATRLADAHPDKFKTGSASAGNPNPKSKGQQKTAQKSDYVVKARATELQNKLFDNMGSCSSAASCNKLADETLNRLKTLKKDLKRPSDNLTINAKLKKLGMQANSIKGTAYSKSSARGADIKLALQDFFTGSSTGRQVWDSVSSDALNAGASRDKLNAITSFMESFTK